MHISLKQSIKLALDIFQELQDLDDKELIEVFLSRGISKDLANEIVVFVPMAFCRIMLMNSRVSFPHSFVFKEVVTGSEQEHLFTDISTFCEAFLIAESRLDLGFNYFIGVAKRSCEYHAISNLVSHGSRLEDIILVPPIIIL
ncbi:hypothetical protein [Synechococcus sp. PCC 7336]|uniref:hypothetical protein n=1 Tax=Synechococcus sp. PCC 7336 TaxID=195250 RepID=UPI00038043F3|nr:hypothetical protein [Synechococcus sp. PCC 7336]